MKKINIPNKLVIILVILISTGVIFYSVSFASYGTVIPGGLCGMGSSYSYTPPSGNYTPAPGSGAVEHSQPGESDHAGYKHNVSMGDVEIAVEGESNYHHSLTFNHGEVPTVKIHTRLKNKTDHEN